MLIKINDLKLSAVVGVYAHEQAAPQEVVVNVAFEYDATRAAADDDMSQAVDYAGITNSIEKLLAAGKFTLIEAMASRIAEMILEDRRITRVSVCVAKPAAISKAASVSATIEKNRN